MISAGEPVLMLPQSHSREWLFCLLAVCLLAACGGEATPIKLSGATMGTTWHLSYTTPENDAPAPEFMRGGIEERLEAINQSMSTYRPDSEISRFNALGAGIWFASSADFSRVLATALKIGQESEGSYDVTVAPLVDLWGFGAKGMVSETPADEDIQSVMGRVGQQYIRLNEEGSAVLKERALAVDFSSLAKGYAVDLLAQWLLAQGVERFMLEVGGEMRVSGLSARGDPWRIAVEQPESSARSIAERLNLTDIAVATSGDYRNYFEVDGRRYSHLIDPRTGYPVAHDLVSVTVLHPQCMIADAWATALTVLGAERAMAVAQAQGLAVYFIRNVDGKFVHSHTPKFSRYMSETQP
jgi:thiamine biosynthesis lipoprotein